MTGGPGESGWAHWPLFGLRLQCREVTLRPVCEVFQGLDGAQHRSRLVYQDYWRSMGTWSPSSWSLAFVVEHLGALAAVSSARRDNGATHRDGD